MHRSTFHLVTHISLALALTIATLSACGNDEAPSMPEPEEVRSNKERVTSPQIMEDDFSQQIAGNSAFAFDLYAQLRTEEGNIFYSPHSISMALAMLHAGARGTTETQIAETLHFVLPQAQLHPAFNKLDLELESRGEGAKAADGQPFRLNVVNALWGQRDYTFLPDYLDTLALNYAAGLRVMDFSIDPEGSRQVINAWVEEQTEDRIKELLAEGVISSMTRLVLTNAIYFNAAWATPFEASNTTNGTFTLVDGSEKTVPLMHGMMSGRHARVGKLQVVELPYDGEELSMVVLLPDAGAFNEVEATLTATGLKEALAAAQESGITLTLPKFETESAFGLKETLEELGMVHAFSPGQADLSGLDGSRNLFVSAVVHKAFVKVNEEGTEAAAATAVVVDERTSISTPMTVSVDRPFVFLIQDHATGAILFVGRVLDPTS
ncbi:MAG: serpin family protein [Deltaproteobacteria bacterium]|nr:serpin family protein [Deltaproteobacteria bacterium]